jgi:hypothetical protein
MNTAAISAVANLLAVGLLIVCGFVLFAEYNAKGRWAKNVTSLLAGLGLWALGFALETTPSNAAVIERIAHTGASRVFLGLSSALLLAAIAAYGVITYIKPIRLWHERKIERDLNRGLPNIP